MRATNAHGFADMAAAYYGFAYTRMRMTAIKTPLKVSTSLCFILSLSKNAAITHTISGVRLHTMPTVDTLKNFKLMKEIKIEKAPCTHLNSREGRFSRSTESTRTFFKFTLINASIIREAITPRLKVS